MSPALAAIPSPPWNAIHIGAFQLRFYGLCIMAGAVLAVQLSQRRWEARGGDPAAIGGLAVWAIPAGFVGARLYHVVTDWGSFDGHWLDVLAVWKGGLGIPGGIALGVVVGVVVARRRHLAVAPLLDVVAPALPLAQAIGRLGNWFNQELFGRPTGLPWGLHIDAAYRPKGYARSATFHPTFLYEALWNLALVALLLWIDRRHRLRPGNLFVTYVIGYGVGRFWVESLRIDAADRVFGIRINLLVSAAAAAIGVAVLVVRSRRPLPTVAPDGRPAEPPSTTAATTSAGPADRD